MHSHILGCADANADFVGPSPQHGDGDVLADGYGFANAAGENKHGKARGAIISKPTRGLHSLAWRMGYRMTVAVDRLRRRRNAKNFQDFRDLGVVGGTGIEPVTPAV